MAEKVERLVNLTIALLEAPAAMSLADIRRRTRYYTEGSAASSRRMFERDKDELRALGVPIETVTLPMSDEFGYTIRRRSYELPDVELTGEEVAALALAVRLTGAQDTPLALAKLAARAPDPVPLDLPGQTRIDVSAEPIDAVADAVLRRIPVRFGYRGADGTTSTRTVDPYGVVQRRAAWYLVGRDHTRNALRAFRLDRMTEPPTTVGAAGAFEPPEEIDLAAAVTGPAQPGVEVTLAVAPEARWAVELRGGRDTGRSHGGWPVLTLDELHPVRDRAWILGLGPSVEVLGPAPLRSAVREGLAAVLVAHGGSPTPGGEGVVDGGADRAGPDPDGLDDHAGPDAGTPGDHSGPDAEVAG